LYLISNEDIYIDSMIKEEMIKNVG
jgi:hypothetical protein